MDFSLSEEQRELSAVAHKWADTVADRALLAAPADVWDPRLGAAWSQMAGAGWLGILVPEDMGGSGGGVLDAVLLAEAFSHGRVPVPFVGNAIVAATGLVHASRAGAAVAEDLRALSAGERRYAPVVSDRLDWPVGSAALAWEWSPGSVALAWRDGQLLPATGLTAVASDTQDVLRKVARVDHASAEDPGPGDAAVRTLAAARVGVAASLLGTMAGALELSVAYAAVRKQFGVAIGSFQAVQHLCADMLVDVETARSCVYGAAWAVDNLGPADAARAAATAKAQAAGAARRVCESAMQVHGGIAFTWEHDMHVYLRAAHFLSASFGTERRCHTELGAARLAAHGVSS